MATAEEHRAVLLRQYENALATAHVKRITARDLGAKKDAAVKAHNDELVLLRKANAEVASLRAALAEAMPESSASAAAPR